MKIASVEFVRSATGAADLPDAGVPEIALVGRSNVGKSTLINALMKRSVARTSGTPGKTRLVNLYRVVTAPTGPFYVVDLPGYGYARKEGRAEFERMAAAYFARAEGPGPRPAAPPTPIGVVLALDARHPGMESDRHTAQWLRAGGLTPLVVVTKIDKLSRHERGKALDRFERLFGPVLPLSAVTGEGLEDLWKQMVSWVTAAPRRQPPR